MSPLQFRYGNNKTLSKDNTIVDRLPLLIDINFPIDFYVTDSNNKENLIETKIKDGDIIWWQNLYGKVFVNIKGGHTISKLKKTKKLNTVIQLSSKLQQKTIPKKQPKKPQTPIRPPNNTPLRPKQPNNTHLRPKSPKRQLNNTPLRPKSQTQLKPKMPPKKIKIKRTKKQPSPKKLLPKKPSPKKPWPKQPTNNIPTKKNKRFIIKQSNPGYKIVNPEIKELFNIDIIPSILRYLLKKSTEKLDFIFCDNKLNTFKRCIDI